MTHPYRETAQPDIFDDESKRHCVESIAEIPVVDALVVVVGLATARAVVEVHAFLHGPVAPTRKRKMRIAKKIAARDGRLRYPHPLLRRSRREGD